ncbi:GAF and ANTAR domain-containing protein [Cellulomonas sp. Y8]|uniref:GAF and ANTAR domain-containing protein n=1 Tax=Cellulomonas sp. Y8 TaxID=2591145 RepID=UPI003D72A953
MVDRAALLAALTATAAQGAGGTLVGRLCEAARVVADADGASIALTPGRRDYASRSVLWATDAVAARIEQIHDVVGRGPASDVARTDEGVSLTLADTATPWPEFAEMTTRHTPAVLLAAVPLHAGSGVLGVLTLYRSRPGPLEGDLADLGFVADVIAVAVLDGTAPGTTPPSASWDERSAIHQAAGMVMAQLAVSADDALALLRAHAFALDLTLPEVAHQVLDRLLLFRPEEGP